MTRSAVWKVYRPLRRLSHCVSLCYATTTPPVLIQPRCGADVIKSLYFRIDNRFSDSDFVQCPNILCSGNDKLVSVVPLFQLLPRFGGGRSSLDPIVEDFLSVVALCPLFLCAMNPDYIYRRQQDYIIHLTYIFFHTILFSNKSCRKINPEYTPGYKAVCEKYLKLLLEIRNENSRTKI